MDFSIYRMLDQPSEVLKDISLKYEKIGKTITRKVKVACKSASSEIECEVQFFHDADYKDNEVAWANFWAKYVKSKQTFDRRHEYSSGIVTVELCDTLYCISFGNAYHYINKYSSAGFALDFAEKVLTDNSIDVKSAKYFKISKTRALTQYSKSTYPTVEVGESDELVIGRVDIDKRYKKLKITQTFKDMKFGSSLKVAKNNVTGDDIVELICEIHKLSDELQPQVSLPRIKLVPITDDTEELRHDLDMKLTEDLLSGSVPSATLAYFTEENGDIVIKDRTDSEVRLVYDHKRWDTTFNLTEIVNQLREIGCNNIRKVSLYPDVNEKYFKPLKHFIDYQTKHRNENYCLYKGRWAKYNDSYIRYVDEYIQQVNEITEVDRSLDLTDELLNDGKRIKEEHKNKYDKVKYAEYPYNIFVEHNRGYQLLDRMKNHQLFTQVEFCDLYGQARKSLIHVKIGDVTSLRACVAQSLRSAQIFTHHRDVLDEAYGISSDDVKEICLHFVVSTSNMFLNDNEFNFGLNQSMYFKIELIEWMNVVRSLGFTPKVIVCKDCRSNN